MKEKDWREILNTPYDKQLESISKLFTTSHNLSTIGEVLEKVFSFEGDFILVGGLARRFHSSPRNTGDIDILFKTEVDKDSFLLINVGKYKKLREHAIMIDGVEVDLLTPEFLGINNNDLVNYIFSTKEITQGNISVVSKEALILLKLYRLSPTDDNDIRALIEAGGKSLNVSDILRLSGDKLPSIKSILNQSQQFLRE